MNKGLAKQAPGSELESPQSMLNKQDQTREPRHAFVTGSTGKAEPGRSLEDCNQPICPTSEPQIPERAPIRKLGKWTEPEKQYPMLISDLNIHTSMTTHPNTHIKTKVHVYTNTERSLCFVFSNII